MDDEWKVIVSQIIYGSFTIIAIIGAFLTQDLVITGTTAFIGAIVIVYLDNIIRKVLKKATGVTDAQLDEIKDDISPLSEEAPKIEPTPIGTTSPG